MVIFRVLEKEKREIMASFNLIDSWSQNYTYSFIMWAFLSEMYHISELFFTHLFSLVFLLQFKRDIVGTFFLYMFWGFFVSRDASILQLFPIYSNTDLCKEMQGLSPSLPQHPSNLILTLEKRLIKRKPWCFWGLTRENLDFCPSAVGEKQLKFHSGIKIPGRPLMPYT